MNELQSLNDDKDAHIDEFMENKARLSEENQLFRE
jgi:hypothetical protein